MNKIKTLIQHCIPQHALSRLAGIIANCQWVWWRNYVIKDFIRRYKVDLSIAVNEHIEDYPNFNSFFTRHLKPGVRPIVQNQGDIACPADGSISQIGAIHHTALIQAKGHYFSLNALLGGSEKRTKLFYDGYFTTIYLSPKDYHRVHMPLTGTLRETIYIPGKLFSVNTATTQAVPQLFARNERLVCLFDTEAGPMAVILVGAMLVSSIKTVWNDHYPPHQLSKQIFEQGITLERGAELGHFQMGSTVIVLFAKNAINWAENLAAMQEVNMGQLLGRTI